MYLNVFWLCGTNRKRSSYECFILRAMRLSSKLLIQGYLLARFEIIIQEVLWSRSYDLIQQYEVSLSRMLNDILTLDHLQLLSNRSDFPPISWPWYRAWPSTNYEHLQRMWHAGRERLPFRTPGSVTLLGTCLWSNCWDPNLSCISLTFHLEHPSALSRFCPLSRPRRIILQIGPNCVSEKRLQQMLFSRFY